MRAENIKRSVVLIVLGAVLSSISLNWLVGKATVNAQQTGKEEKPAEQVYKNIQVLKGMPASQLQGAMSFISASLGVDCSHCHMPPQFDKDDKLAKQTARRMMLMMRDINRENFADKVVVNCATCHQGQTKPSAIPPLPRIVLQDEKMVGTKSDTTLPTVDQILDIYVKALGGSAAFDKVKTRMRKGTVEITGGLHGTFEVYEAAPNKMLLNGNIPTPRGTINHSEGFNGTIGWVNNNGRVSEMSGEGLVQAKRESDFYANIKLKEQYAVTTVAGKERIGEREAYVVEATLAAGRREKLFFDIATGLLLRKYWEDKTIFGQIPNAIDYEDYRKVGGVKLPFIIRRSRPGFAMVQKASQIKLNIQLDDAKFNKPSTQK